MESSTGSTDIHLCTDSCSPGFFPCEKVRSSYNSTYTILSYFLRLVSQWHWCHHTSSPFSKSGCPCESGDGYGKKYLTVLHRNTWNIYRGKVSSWYLSHNGPLLLLLYVKQLVAISLFSDTQTFYTTLGYREWTNKKCKSVTGIPVRLLTSYGLIWKGHNIFISLLRLFLSIIPLISYI